MAQPIPSTRRGKLPTKNYVPQKKHQKKRRRRLLWVILACVALLIAIPAAVSLPYLMPGARQRRHPGRAGGDAMLAALDLAGDSDAHWVAPGRWR